MPLPGTTNMSESSTAKRTRGAAQLNLRRRLLFRTLAIAVGAAFAFFAAEISFRLMGVGMPSLYTPDHFCGSRLRPATSGVWTREGHGKIIINAKGFRGPEISDEKAAGVFRIAILGDSYIEGLQVDEDATICFQIQQLLNKKNSVPNRKYEVVNCGVSGYGTAQELQMLRHHVLQLQPDVVMVGVYPENDVRNNLRSLEGDPARPYFTLDDDGTPILDDSFRSSVPYVTAASTYERRKAFVINCSRVLQMLKQTKQRVFNSDSKTLPKVPVASTLKASVEDAIYVYAEPTDSAHQEAWELTQRLLEKLCDECHAEQIPVFVFTVSSPVQVYPDPELRRNIATENVISDFFYSEQRIQAVCSSAGAHFYPLASALQEVAESSGNPLHGFPNSGMGIGHWNERGHRTAAQILTSWLAQDDQFKP
jgi:lysophospholipase L1-like esterase